MNLLSQALDSHVYWQLSDRGYRFSGFVADPGSDDPDTAAEIVAAEALMEKLGLVVQKSKVGSGKKTPARKARK